MRLSLVALPWTTFDRPSAAVGQLASVVRARRPGWEVSTWHPYVSLFEALPERYEAIASDARSVGELLFCAVLWPERREAIARRLEGWAFDLDVSTAPFSRDEVEAALDACAGFTESVAVALADEGAEVVGFTTTYSQLFASLAVARRLVSLRPGVRIVLGGVALSWHIGPGVLAEFPFVDAVVQGEGEDRLVALLDRYEGALAGPVPEGVLLRGAPLDRRDTAGRVVVAAPEVADLDALPLPDFDEYAARASEANIRWAIPLEGSRGCWWDRVKRTGDATQTCAFCSLQSVTYRQKSADRLADEIDALVGRHRTPAVYFLDNVLRAKGVTELCDAIEARGRTIRFFYEARANLTALEMLRLQEIGCETIQFGIEALVTSVLRKLGKGTTALMNLNVMRLATELGITHRSNLILRFPTTTDEEVEATVEAVRRFGSAYAPCSGSNFMVGIQSGVHRDPARYGVAELRGARLFEAALPPDVYERLPLFWLEHTLAEPGADWSPVAALLDAQAARWEELRADPEMRKAGGVRPLVYHDGGDFLEIVDRREGYGTVVLDGPHADLYRLAMTPRHRDELRARLAGALTEEEVDATLGALEDANVLYREGNRVLALAVAHRVDVAARRIRAEA